MPIRFSCSCGKAFRASESLAGKRIKCSKCGSIIVVPQPEDEPAEHYETEPQPEPAQETGRKSPRSDRAKRPAAAKQRYPSLSSEHRSTNLLEYGYWLLLFTFIPLA